MGFKLLMNTDGIHICTCGGVYKCCPTRKKKKARAETSRVSTVTFQRRVPTGAHRSKHRRGNNVIKAPPHQTPRPSVRNNPCSLDNTSKDSGGRHPSSLTPASRLQAKHVVAWDTPRESETKPSWHLLRRCRGTRSCPAPAVLGRGPCTTPPRVLLVNGCREYRIHTHTRNTHHLPGFTTSHLRSQQFSSATELRYACFPHHRLCQRAGVRWDCARRIESIVHMRVACGRCRGGQALGHPPPSGITLGETYCAVRRVLCSLTEKKRSFLPRRFQDGLKGSWTCGGAAVEGR